MFALAKHHLPKGIRRVAAWLRAFAFLDDVAPAFLDDVAPAFLDDVAPAFLDHVAPAAVAPPVPARTCHAASVLGFQQTPALPDRRPRTATPAQRCTVADRARTLTRQHPATHADHKAAGR